MTASSSALLGESAWLLREVSYGHPDARRLTQALYREQVAAYGFGDDPADTPVAHFDPPHGLFLIAHRDGVAVGCGGIRLLDANTAEIKRMYVAQTARGQGLGRHILQSLEAKQPPGVPRGSSWRPVSAITAPWRCTRAVDTGLTPHTCQDETGS
ncbi:GNAT family N-acetyltransferase [Streptomyces kaempferi]|uniref:GNAT family N-acetyltransferase n=1 Tax=Streptomyces kaempferi TaxID=333725 RepID=A0ABW3XX78_9ACTN